MANSVLSVKGLSVQFQTHSEKVYAVDNISFDIFESETFGLVGESGSGKSISALAVLRLLPRSAQMSGDHVYFKTQDLLTLTETGMCKIRGRRIAMIFQDPMIALNPVKSIGSQIAEVIKIHFNLTAPDIHDRVLTLLRQVEIPSPESRINDYPHQFSGGQLQRIMIAAALAGEPDLLIADEPTTALDVTIQAQILTLLKSIQDKVGMSLWLISHDLALVSTVADRVAVMLKGCIVEVAPTMQLFKQPKHPYTQTLLAALPSFDSCSADTVLTRNILLEVKNIRISYPVRKGIFNRVVSHIKAVDGVSFSIQEGKTLALVGESGCGKTTLGKGLLNLVADVEGQVLWSGKDINGLKGDSLRRMRSNIQIIFQDPYSSMNPRMLVGQIIDEGMRSLHPQLSAKKRQAKVAELLQQVGLPVECAMRYPHEFSGGQRQRICIARALAVQPKLIICDEPTSALDVSVQDKIIVLLKSLQRHYGISYLFITHDLAVVAEMADELAVMYQGKIVESGPVYQVLNDPQQPYTQRLLNAVPKIVWD
ncbi:MAG TPA: ABC transporter ATP-binding protein [Methylococcaceae bacterium]|jgi:ABC-type microcin C transport system duplicated ATPase subunit YejF|nr:ABC transporter ATP-binding protein [Methylococcaceae bacterium]HIA45717.1 ABC transporter ATP-binding protein [Methylococcaceae bacterium]HIB62080.1 ABC transporter ATP-binding protein [Methylococcaceae bacterium]HIN68963.1 ABC transporter ATP-binding protein [Methylococcales bacterium]HIO12640.1 ABC transporter ATP-binding protein [Methylococcales bacterium]